MIKIYKKEKKVYFQERKKMNNNEVNKIIKKNKVLLELSKIMNKKKLDFYLKYSNISNKWSKKIKEESLLEMENRCKKIFNKIKKNKGNILLVSHGSFIKFFISYLTKINNYIIPCNIIGSSPNCHITILKVKDNKFNFIKIRDNTHLEKLYN